MKVIRHCASILLFGVISTAAHPDFETGVTAYMVGDYDTAFREFHTQAEDGYPPAQYNLAQMYRLGQGVSSDMQQAMRWYRRAAENGHGDAQFSLGYIYESGDVVPRDATEAIKWYELAALQGTDDAAHNLGVLYESGDGIERDWVSAYAWFDLAVNAGDYEAASHIRNLTSKLAEPELEKARALAERLHRRIPR